MAVLSTVIGRGLAAAKPGTPAEGYVYFSTDTGVLERYSGSTWESIGDASPLTTKGDTFVYGAADDRLPVGTDGDVITADSAQALGVKWAAPAATGLPWWAQLAANPYMDGYPHTLANWGYGYQDVDGPNSGVALGYATKAAFSSTTFTAASRDEGRPRGPYKQYYSVNSAQWTVACGWGDKTVFAHLEAYPLYAWGVMIPTWFSGTHSATERTFYLGHFGYNASPDINATRAQAIHNGNDAFENDTTHARGAIYLKQIHSTDSYAYLCAHDGTTAITPILTDIDFMDDKWHDVVIFLDPADDTWYVGHQGVLTTYTVPKATGPKESLNNKTTYAWAEGLGHEIGLIQNNAAQANAATEMWTNYVRGCCLLNTQSAQYGR